MARVRASDVPRDSLLRKYKDGSGFADCYVIEVPGTVSLATYVEAFYTSPLFAVERWLLRTFAASPATNADARLLARGEVARYSAWRVEGRSRSELLLADVTGRTRSWLMTAPTAGGHGVASTVLHFGSAVLPRAAGPGQSRAMGWPFHALMGFHRVYSRLLLRAACRRLRAGGSTQ
jgi:hypothetical protein